MWKVIKSRVAQICVIVVVVLGLIAALLYFLLVRRRGGRQGEEESAEEMRKAVQNARDKISEANVKAVIKVVIARNEQEDVKEELERIDAVKDEEERRRRLLQLYNEVSAGDDA